MKEHKLKTLSHHFEPVCNGEKKAEVRFNDRDYKVNDILVLKEYKNKEYTGNEQRFKITHILYDFKGLRKNWVCLSINKI